MSTRALLALLVLPILGCAAPNVGEPETIADASSADEVFNGPTLNGTSLNGHTLNGHTLNGRSLNGVALNLRVGGVSAGKTWLEGSALLALKGNKILHGDGLEGATLDGTLDDGSPITLRIDDASEVDDVRAYAVSYQADGGFTPLCGVDASGAAITAIALAGRWSYAQGVAGGGAHVDDPSSFTFACQGFALAKCVELGYAPWSYSLVFKKSSISLVSLAPYHQACTRMLRADYCGDGSSFTVDGTELDVYDAIGIQKDTDAWSFEAEWTPNGARCASHPRIASMPTPSCWSNVHTSSCGALADFNAGALMFSEDAPSP